MHEVRSADSHGCINFVPPLFNFGARLTRKIAFAFPLLLAACGGSDPIGPGANAGDLTGIQPGEVRVLVPSDIPNGLDIPSAATASEFVVIVGNSESKLDRVASYQVRTSAQSGAPSILGAERVAALLSPGDEGGHRQMAVEKRIRGYERSSLRLARTGATGLPRLSVRHSVAAGAPVPAVGDIIDAKIPLVNSADLCENFVRTRAVVRAVSRRAIIAVDTLGGAGAFTTTQLNEISAEFDNLTFPVDSAYFGNPTDVDANQRIILLFTPQVNLLTPPSGPNASFVAGFFFGGDFFPPTQAGCTQSNEAEIFYLLAPDPDKRFNNTRSTESVRQGTRGTIAHELQHMINAGRRYQNASVDAFEASWLDEALSHLAEDMVGRTRRNFTESQPLTLQQLLPPNDAAAANDFSAFFFQNFARFREYLIDTENFSALGAGADTSLAARGAGWALLRYSADTYRSADIRAFTRKLTAGPDTSLKNFLDAVGVPLDTVIANFLVTNYSDHLGIPNLDPRFSYKSYDMRNIMPRIEAAIRSVPSAAYPLRIQSLGNAESISSKNRSGTGSYYRVTVDANAPPRNVKIVDGGGAAISFPGAHIYVLRVN